MPKYMIDLSQVAYQSQFVFINADSKDAAERFVKQMIESDVLGDWVTVTTEKFINAIDEVSK